MAKEDLYDDLLKALIIAVLVVVMCLMLRGTDWERERSVFTELNERVSQTAD